MSKERTSPDEQTNDGSDSSHQDDNAKRAKLTSPSDTTLQHLPVEILEYILVKAVAIEVIGMKLAKSVWNKKIDPVIERLGTVSSLWNSIVTTDIFRDQVTRILNNTAQETIHVEKLYNSPLKFYVYGITTLKDEIFLFGKADSPGYPYLINVYERNNMAVVKDVIPLTGLRPKSISACTVSNCVYILNRKIRDQFSILRIASTNDHWSLVSPLISDICLPWATLCVTASGSVVLSREQTEEFAAISVCDSNGSTEREIRLPALSLISRIWDIIQKSNGNLVLVSNESSSSRTVDFVEINMNGIIIRRYQSPRYASESVTSLADSYGRVWAADKYHGLKLLDSEFNDMDFTGQIHYTKVMHYNRARNEIVVAAADRAFVHGKLIIFRLKEM